jgi:hypothetical protein
VKVALASVILLATATLAAAQSPTVEIATSAGYSSEGVGATAVQLRTFGETRDDLRYYLEAAWGDRGYSDGDAFGASYPYDDRISLIEGYAEKRFASNGSISGLRAGQFRPPFGIYSRSDQGYVGFLRAPLIRYGGVYALSNFWLDAGADAFFATPNLMIEASVGSPQEKSESRDHGTSSVYHIQGYRGNWIVGASYLDSPRNQLSPVPAGRTRFTGVDARWMNGGVQARGEWVSGKPFEGVKTKGWYADLFVHRPFMNNVTAVARAEGIDYEAGPYSFHRKRYTIGAKVVLTPSWVASVNAIHQTGFPTRQDVILDAGMTYTIRR